MLRGRRSRKAGGSRLGGLGAWPQVWSRWPARPGGRRRAQASCPLAALKKAKKPVEITMWHSMPRANEETLQQLTDKFNSSQSDVKVNARRTR